MAYFRCLKWVRSKKFCDSIEIAYTIKLRIELGDLKCSKSWIFFHLVNHSYVLEWDCLGEISNNTFDNMTHPSAAPVSSSKSTVLAVARSSTTSKNKELQEGKNFNFFSLEKVFLLDHMLTSIL